MRQKAHLQMYSEKVALQPVNTSVVAVCKIGRVILLRALLLNAVSDHEGGLSSEELMDQALT